jgi:hypothetical protein
MNKPIELLKLLACYFGRILLIGVLLAAALILLRHEGCMAGFCDH